MAVSWRTANGVSARDGSATRGKGRRRKWEGVQPLLPLCTFCSPSPISGAPYVLQFDVLVVIHCRGGTTMKPI